MYQRVLCVVCVMCLALSSNFAFGGGFTYQGKLLDGGVGANGVYDIEFTLRRVSDFSVVSGPIVATVLVTDGIFTYTLDFGDWAFDETDRSLQIRVRPENDPGGYTELQPSIVLSHAPTAIYSRQTRGLSMDSFGRLDVGEPDATKSFVIRKDDSGAIASAVETNPFGISTALSAIHHGEAEAFSAWSHGTARAAEFRVAGSTNTSDVIRVTTTALGQGGLFQILNPSNSLAALRATTSGTGPAGQFDGDLKVRDLFLKDYGTNEYTPAAPVAYGTFFSDGTKASGTANLSAVWNATTSNYELTINGMSYNYSLFTATVTPAGSTVLVPTTNSVSGKLIVSLTNLSGTRQAGIFQVVIYDGN